MTTRGQINSNFYQIVNVDVDGNPTDVKQQYVPYSNHANVANVANSVSVGNVVGIGNIATINLDGNSSHILYGNGVWANAPSTANANYANYAGNAFNVSGSNVSGAVNLANYATVANSVAVANVSGIGNIATVNLDGNVSNVLSGLGTWIPVGTVANANYANYAGNAFSVSGANVVGSVANANYANFSNVANIANSVAGANVTGTVGNATHATVSNSANSVAVANVSGIGNIATVNLDGNVSNVLSGLGTWIPMAGGANANYANYAGNVVNASQPNITSLGTLSSLTVSGNITSGNANLGNLATANFFGGDGGLLSNITGANVTGYVPYANIANTVAIQAQPNITSLGTLSSLTVTGLTTATGGVKTGNIQDSTGTNTINVGYTYPADVGITGNLTIGVGGAGNLIVPNNANITGNITVGNANLGNLATANFFSGDGGLLSNIQSANVVGNLPVRFDVKNTSGGTLTKGTPIYITGSVGVSGTVEVSASRADTAGTMGCVGMLEQTLTNNAMGTALSIGQLSGMNTNAYTIGQTLYVAATGGLTNVRPVDGYIVQSVGVVSRVNASTGIIEVNIWNINGLPNLDNGNIWVGTTGNGYPVQAVLATANVGNANFASYAGNVTVNSQPNITSLGTLTSLTVTGNTNVGNLSATGALLATGLIRGDTLYAQGVNGIGTTTKFVWGQPGTGGAATFMYRTGNALNKPNDVTFDSNIVLGGGGQGNIDLYGNINFLGYYYINSNSNIILNPTGTTQLGANNKVSITGGSSGQVLKTDGLGNLSWTGSIDTANTAGTVTTGAQPNITSTGTLVSLTVTGNITSGNASLGNLASANYFSGNGSLLSSLTGGNVTGTVPLATSATSATTAGTVTTGAQPNITSTGNLVSVNVTGTANIGNLVTTKYNETTVSGGSVSGSITPDVATGTIFNYTLTGNITLNSLANAVAGSGCTLILTQGGSGSYTLTSTMKYLGGTKTLSTAVGAIDIVSVFYDGTTYYACLGKGYA